jgi:hypothetical protein
MKCPKKSTYTTTHEYWDCGHGPTEGHRHKTEAAAQKCINLSVLSHEKEDAQNRLREAWPKWAKRNGYKNKKEVRYMPKLERIWRFAGGTRKTDRDMLFAMFGKQYLPGMAAQLDLLDFIESNGPRFDWRGDEHILRNSGGEVMERHTREESDLKMVEFLRSNEAATSVISDPSIHGKAKRWMESDD